MDLKRPRKPSKKWDAGDFKVFVNELPETETGCKEWPYSCYPSGYGHLKFGEKLRGAHRVSYEIFKGEIPTGLEVMHSCDNPKCINPQHLDVGTRTQNTQDAIRKGRAPQLTSEGTSLRRLRLNGENHSQAKLTWEEVKAIRAEAHTSTRAQLAKKYNVHHNTIGYILLGKTWNNAG